MQLQSSHSSDKHINYRIKVAVAKTLAAHTNAADNKKSDDEAVDSYIVSAFQCMIGKKPTTQDPGIYRQDFGQRWEGTQDQYPPKHPQTG
jgi:hypothetical protein